MPIPPQLVVVLREHLDTFGTAKDGRLFFSEGEGVVSSSTCYRAWQEARVLALPPAVAASPLAHRPYDLRHSALSTWLNADVDPTEVAERAGNSVEALLSRYATWWPTGGSKICSLEFLTLPWGMDQDPVHE